MATKEKATKEKATKKKTTKAPSGAARVTNEGLPKVGKPAERALAAIGVVKLDHVARYREEQLLELHGFGPKALGILRTALAAKGKAFKK